MISAWKRRVKVIRKMKGKHFGTGVIKKAQRQPLQKVFEGFSTGKFSGC